LTDYPLGCVRYDGNEGTLLVTVPIIPTLASAKLQLSVDFGAYAAALPFLTGVRGAIEHARLAKSILDEARANPAGQCCEAPNNQPLKDLAALGVKLESIGGHARLARTTTSTRARRATAEDFVRVARAFPTLVTAAANEMRVLGGTEEAALRVVRHYLLVNMKPTVTMKMLEAKDPNDLKNMLIVTATALSNAWTVHGMQAMSFVELALKFGEKSMLAAEKFYVVEADKRRNTASERLMHALALMETAEDRIIRR
jgi:hypothetical protein